MVLGKTVHLQFAKDPRNSISLIQQRIYRIKMLVKLFAVTKLYSISFHLSWSIDPLNTRGTHLWYPIWYTYGFALIGEVAAMFWKCRKSSFNDTYRTFAKSIIRTKVYMQFMYLFNLKLLCTRFCLNINRPPSEDVWCPTVKKMEGRLLYLIGDCNAFCSSY